ncbi:MAG: serine/threonine-protein phosphatase [Ignavibacteriae bacterium]|nr:serine/threonine-protein phosphatase [Ignavibacteriota bacterium]
MKSNPNNHSTLFETLKKDIQRGDFRSTVSREFHELKDFMLDDERKKRLQQMGRVKGWFYVVGWLMKTMFFRLTPTRRLLVVVGLLFLFFSRARLFDGENIQIETNTGILGGLMILFVLMLELKDKLLAKEELEAGHAVQKALMPERSPKVEGWEMWLFTRSANDVGGDLVDCIKVDEERFAVMLADVAGKGLSAALLTSKLQATIRALAPDAESLPLLATKLNTIFCRDSLPNVFASLVYVELRCGSGEVKVLNAGHFPALCIYGNEIRKTEKGGAALGLTKTAQYREQKIVLQENELMVIYSDGLTEARNVAGEFYGEHRIQQLLPLLTKYSVGIIGEMIIAELDRFVGSARTHDDVSIVVLKKV